MSGTVRFAILGPVRAWYDDRELDLGPTKQRAVLAVLLLSAGRPVTTTAVVDAVWPEDPPANGPNVVQKYVAGLRRVLEPDRPPRAPGQQLTRTDAGYLLRAEADAVDALRFEQGIQRAHRARSAGQASAAIDELGAALSLWQGEPLAGLSGPFFDAARLRLAESRASALETHAELALGLGQHEEVVGELVRLAVDYPVRERLRYLLMLSLYRSGRQAEALAAYREIHALLRDEHGLAPGDRLQQLHSRILRSDPSLDPPQPPARGRPLGADNMAPPTAAPDAATASSAASHAAGSAASSAAMVDPNSAAADRTTAEAAAPTRPDTRFQTTPAVPLPSRPDAVVPVWPGPDAPVWPYPPITLNPLPLAAVAPPPAPPTPPRWLSNLGTAVTVAMALVTFGALSWLGVLFYAIRRRSRWLALAAAGYLALALLFVYAMEVSDVDAPPTVLDGVAIIGLAAAWLGGAAHLILINRNVVAMMRGQRTGRAARAQHERAVRREHARYLLHHYPAARDELRIGRPDLPRRFDDGGLVDINAVAESAIMHLPGVAPHQRRQIAMDRSLGGPYRSIEELVARCRLGAVESDSLRPVLIFLPPPPVPAEAPRRLVERPDE
ncbi:MAG TPA: BTAD domain-containing putative transcriptional regulator [Micromonosporaceae bacterium]